MVYSSMPKYQVTVTTSAKGVACLMCSFGDVMEQNVVADSTQEMIDHLAAHRRVGDLLPDNIEARLWEDDPTNYPKKPTQLY